MWNQPDIGYWHGSHPEYFKLFDFTEKALRGVLPNTFLAGSHPWKRPHAAGAPDHCTTGVQATTGMRLDMVAFRAKGDLIQTASANEVGTFLLY